MTRGSLCGVVSLHHMQEVAEKIFQTTDCSGPTTVAVPTAYKVSIDLIGLLLLPLHC